MRSKQSRVVAVVAVSGVAACAFATAVFQRSALEWWSIWRLGSEDAAVRGRATDRLVDMGSVAAFPALMRASFLDLRAVEKEHKQDFFRTLEDLYAQIARGERKVAALRETLRGAKVMTFLTQGSLQRQIGSLESQAATLKRRIRQALGLRDLPSYRAMDQIARRTGAVAVARLQQLLGSPTWQNRWLAVHLLTDLDTRKYAISLEEAALDENEHVRSAAMAALGELQGAGDSWSRRFR